jgi:hypothetical protein
MIESTYSCSSFRGIGVVEAQVALAAVAFREAEVQADRLRVSKVQVAVRLRRKARLHAAVVLAEGEIGVDLVVDEVVVGLAGRGL